MRYLIFFLMSIDFIACFSIHYQITCVHLRVLLIEKRYKKSRNLIIKNKLFFVRLSVSMELNYAPAMVEMISREMTW